MPDEPRIRYLSTAQICQIYEIERSTIYRWVRNGWIEEHTRTSGGHYRWDPEKFGEDMQRVYRERADERALRAEQDRRHRRR